MHLRLLKLSFKIKKFNTYGLIKPISINIIGFSVVF